MKLVERVVSTKLPTVFGDFVAVGYRSLVDNKHHVALVKGDVEGEWYAPTQPFPTKPPAYSRNGVTPDILVLGYDQRLPDAETEAAVRALGVEIVVMPWFPGKEDPGAAHCS